MKPDIKKETSRRIMWTGPEPAQFERVMKSYFGDVLHDWSCEETPDGNIRYEFTLHGTKTNPTVKGTRSSNQPRAFEAYVARLACFLSADEPDTFTMDCLTNLADLLKKLFG